MLGELRYACDVNVFVFFYAFRPVERLAGISTPAQRSSPQTNVHVLHTFLVLYRHPNRLHGRQEVGLSVCTCGLHVSLCFSPHLISFSSFSPAAEEFDPEENLHSTEGQSHM